MPDAKNIEIGKPKVTKALHRAGLCISVVWMVSFLAYVGFNQTAMLELEPNEVGDFLSGMFAPLAFLWLVLGFFQQGEELRHSGDALWLQGQELQNSVQQQRELVEVTREQLQFESARLGAEREALQRAAQPLLEIAALGNSSTGQAGYRAYDFRITNHGRQCTAFKAMQGTDVLAAQPALGTGESATFRLALRGDHDAEIDIVMTYLDGLFTTKSTIHRIVKAGQQFDILAL